MPDEVRTGEIELSGLREVIGPSEPQSPQRLCFLCRGEVPEGARLCRHCGRPLARWRRWRNVLLSSLIVPLVVGASIFKWGQRAERAQIAAQQDRDNYRLILALKWELSSNHANINNVRNLLTKDLEDLQRGQHSITPLLSFHFTAWEQAKYGRGDFLERADTADLKKLVNCYLILSILDQKIRDREQHRYLGEGRPGFVERMQALDQSILDGLNHVQKILEEAQEFLDTIHQWRVRGRNFSVDRGRVIDLEGPHNNTAQSRTPSLR